MDYFDKGVLRNGFALIAWPADYGASGVMTFIVNQDGVVFQKDLGEGTEAAVAAIDAYDPDSTWVAVSTATEKHEGVRPFSDVPQVPAKNCRKTMAPFGLPPP